jgi:hypothetical protein
MPFKRPAKMFSHDDTMFHLGTILGGTDLDVTSDKNAPSSRGTGRTFFSRFLYLFWHFKISAKTFSLVMKFTVTTFGRLNITTSDLTGALIYGDNSSRNVKRDACIHPSVVKTAVTFGVVITLTAFYQTTAHHDEEFSSLHNAV